MATTEHTINDAIAELLRGTRRAWHENDVISSENTGQIKGSNARPDILVVEPNVSPVVIETEVLAAVTVESEAVARLGAHMKKTGRTILSSIAVRLPLRLREKAGKALQKELASATDLEMVLFTGNSPSVVSRFPHGGWMVGTVADLSILTQSASVPPDVIDAAATNLVNGVSEAAGLLGDIAKANPDAIHKISQSLCQEDGEQTRRMATTILANAFVFQESLAGKIPDVSSLEELRGSKKGLTRTSILAEWRKILEVNYWPIFEIARRILEVIPIQESKPLIERMAETADRLLENHLMRSHDLTGAVFQRMIVDRKFLAAYYTTPASAALLIGLAIVPELTPTLKPWTSAEDVKSLKIADFACGTGTLLTTAYSRIGQLHELAGGDSEAIHSEMMANALIGCDVLPAAAHLTASMLSGAHPTVTYDRSSILTVAYGLMPNGSIALGSIDLLDDQKQIDILDMTAKAVTGMGEKEMETWSSLPHASFDLVVMNPPFVRPTGHEGKKIGVPVPMFAAFSNSDEEQYMMSKAMKKLTKGTSYHGNAGEASAFLVIADRKLKPGGMLALVMPLSLMPGDAWEDSRELLAKNYSGLVLASIAGRGSEDMSFSADTGMGECLVVGRKSDEGSKRATFIVLKERPASTLVGSSLATQIHRLIAGKKLRRLEDGPVGGTEHRISRPFARAGLLESEEPSEGVTVNTEANQRPLTKLVYVLCAAIVIQTSILSIYDRLITSGAIVHKHFAQWETLVKDYYCVSILLTVLITIGAIMAFYHSPGTGLNWRSMAATNGNKHIRNLALGLGGGTLAFALSLPLLARGDPAAKLGARLLSQSIGLSWGSILVLLVALLLLPVTIEILVCSITFDTLAHYASVPAAVIASSLLFAFLWPILNSTVAAILGAISALLYHRTRSLTAPIVASIVLTISGVSFALFQPFR